MDLVTILGLVPELLADLHLVRQGYLLVHMVHGIGHDIFGPSLWQGCGVCC